MGKLEKPLTWILIIGLLGYLFVANCKCDKSAPPTQEVTISDTDVLKIDAPENSLAIDTIPKEVEEGTDIDTLIDKTTEGTEEDAQTTE